MGIRIYKLLAITLILVISYNNSGYPQNKRVKAIAEIEKAERDFNQMASREGIAKAFWFYADNNAVIKRENDTLIKGKAHIRQYYSAPFYTNATVEWSPDFTDASANGDLGYTYGKYTWLAKDSTGKTNEYKGVFHTVWRKQKDGGWKFVWD